MGKWIEWIPEMAHGVHQQLLHEAGKHSSVIWLVEPPPMVRLSCTPVEMKAIQHYIDEGGVPVGWIDQRGYVHAFRLKPPFDPPNFSLTMPDLGTLGYNDFAFTKAFVGEMYDELCMMSPQLKKRVGGNV